MIGQNANNLPGGYEFCFEAFFFDPDYDELVAVEAIFFNGSHTPEIGFNFAQFASAYQPDELILKPNLLRAWWG